MAQPIQSKIESGPPPLPGTRRRSVAAKAKLPIRRPSRRTSSKERMADRSKHSGGTAARISASDGTGGVEEDPLLVASEPSVLGAPSSLHIAAASSQTGRGEIAIFQALHLSIEPA
mmetsp:Transcript_31260/g.55207  ORF Transcript_31260/g.55207 Transcript_31260/m.55207 type:complete len:116 (+) Transcript_31260:110-457(+)